MKAPRALLVSVLCGSLGCPHAAPFGGPQPACIPPQGEKWEEFAFFWSGDAWTIATAATGELRGWASCPRRDGTRVVVLLTEWPDDVLVTVSADGDWVKFVPMNVPRMPERAVPRASGDP